MGTELPSLQDAGPRMLVLGPALLRTARAAPFLPERRFQLLAVLATRANEWVARDEMAALLWPERNNADARRNLRHVVFKALALPGVGGLEASEHALRWDVETDLLVFAQSLRDGDRQQAIALRRGRLLEGIDDPGNAALGDWLAEHRARFDARWQQAAHETLATQGTPQQRVDLAQQLLTLDPLDEAAVAALLEAELALGRNAAAQRLYLDYAHRLADELGIEPSHQLRDLLGREVPAPTTPAFAPPAPPAVPDPGAPFVGRRSEMAELMRLLAPDGARAVTVLGPGGVGKSSLSRRVLQAVADSFTGGRFWVELQDLAVARAVVARLAEQLGVAINDAQDAVAQIGRRLGAKRVLCVLDNAEHLAELAALIERLLAAAPGLSLLVTSRVRLGHASEHCLPLAGLAVPDEDSRDLEAAVAFDAVRLFEARAAVAQPGFSLAQHLGAVIDIVEAVGGLPLAIEIAAGWVRLLPAQEIAHDLRRSMDLLERDPASRDAQARPEHGSMRAVLERSWSLLAPREREALAALSVFQGGFTRAAALAVTRAPLALLSSLVDKSLLAVDDAGRFALHPLVAAIAAERLGDDVPRADECARRHASYYAKFVAELAARGGNDHRPLTAGIDAEYANCRAAWQRAVVDASTDQLAQSAGPWRLFFDVRGRIDEGVAQLEPALPLAAAAPALAAALRAALSRLHYRRGDYALGLSLGLAGADMARRRGDRRALAACLSNAGSCHSAEARWAEARACFDETLQIAHADGVPVEEAAALNNLGIIARKEGRFDEAIDHYRRAIAIERDLGHHVAVVRCLNNIAGVHGSRGEWAQKRQAMVEGLQLCERYDLDGFIPNLAFGLGAALLELGDLGNAERMLQRALDSSRRADNPTVALFAEANLGRVAARRGQFAATIERLRAAACSARERGWMNESLQLALFYGECLREAGRPVQAARIWHMVDAHPQAEAGLRASARRWNEGLALTPVQREQAERDPVTLAEVTERLLSERALDADAPPLDKR
jgi:predicted ATPase/DNA-binding SARP family transcriptional activator